VEIVNSFLGLIRRTWASRASRGRRAQEQRFLSPAVEVLESRWVPSTTGASSITGNFNGTAVPAGDTIWFSSAFKVNGAGKNQQVILNFTNSVISFTAGGTNYTVNAPDAEVILSPTTTTATTTFNAALNEWVTTLPMSFSGNGFLDGVALNLTSALPGGVHNVTWSGNFSTNTPGVTVNWQWAAGAYTNFGTDYNSLGIKPTDDNHVSTYQNSDHAGAPENYLSFVVGGCTGGGGSNYTGSLSATASVVSTTQGSISGFVTDTSGTALSGVTLTLTGVNSQGQTVSETTTTDQNGYYQFTGLTSGTYAVTVTPPAGYQNVSDSVGTVNGVVDGTAASGSLNNIGLTAGGLGLNYDFVEGQQVMSGSGGIIQGS
jgi:hypothetical protein